MRRDFGLVFFAILSLLIIKFITAAPTKLTNNVGQSLDDSQSLESDRELTIIVPLSEEEKHPEKNYKIKKEMAEKSNFLIKTMENDKDESFFTIQSKPEEFEMILNYLKNPDYAHIKWTTDMLPDLINAANYLEVESMLKDVLRQLCVVFSHQSLEKLVELEQKIPKVLFLPLFHCVNDNPPQHWSFKNETLDRRAEFMTKCHLNSNYVTGNLKRILNPSLDCFNYIKKKLLNLLLPSTLSIDYDNWNDYDATANLFKKMGFKISLHGLCNKLNAAKSALVLQSLFLRAPESLIVPLLHCVNDRVPQDWNLLNEAMQKKQEFSSKCRLDWTCFNRPSTDISALRNILNPKPECLEYMTMNHLKLVTAPELELQYNNLKDFDESLHTLKSMNVNQLSLSLLHKDIKLPLLFESLKEVPHLTFLKIICDDKARLHLDMNQFPSIPNLDHLIISQCRLDNQSTLFQRKFPELKILDLSDNEMDHIGACSKEFMPKLQSLNLNDNQIHDISELFTSKLPMLESLYLNNNQIQTVPKIECIPQLSTMLLIDNPISDISGLMTTELPRCGVFLSGNQLENFIDPEMKIKLNLV